MEAVKKGTYLRKSKRIKMASSRIDGRFECGKRIKTITGQQTLVELHQQIRLDGGSTRP